MCHAAQTLVSVKLNVFLLMQINFISLLMKLLVFSSQIPFQRCNYSEPCLPSSLAEMSNSFAKIVLPFASTTVGFKHADNIQYGLPLLSHSKFSRGFSWKVAPVQPQGHFFENACYVKHESHSPLRNPTQPSFLSGCYSVMNKGEAQTSLPHSEHFRATYRFQSCSGLKLGAECIICTCPETITDKHLPDTA